MLPATEVPLQLEILEIHGNILPINTWKCLKTLFEPCLVFQTIKSPSPEHQWTKPRVLCPGMETPLFNYGQNSSTWLCKPVTEPFCNYLEELTGKIAVRFLDAVKQLISSLRAVKTLLTPAST